MISAVVNRIIPFSSVDGPGNRTTVFLQGCNINCRYCHNPETRKLCPECGDCVKECPAKALSYEEGHVVYNISKCIDCDTCIRVCKHDSTPKTRIMTPYETYREIKKNIPYIRGITVSGGECMLNPGFVTELFALAKKDGLNTLIDTNGTISFDNKSGLLALTDGVMLDIKAFDSNEHKNITDLGNEVVLDNAKLLSHKRKLFEIRSVIAPDLYDTKKSITDMAKYLMPLYQEKSFRIKIIAFRPMGVRSKYVNTTVPDTKHLEELQEILMSYGYRDIVII